MSKWPKKLPVLTDDQKRIKDDFMKEWHEVLPNKYGLVEKFNHGFPVKSCPGGGRVLEIGAGLGEHIRYEDTASTEYFALELRPEMAEEIKKRFAGIRVITGDCQKKLDFPDHYFDKVLAIHVLEHLPDLPAALREIARVLKPGGRFCAMIPCEGGAIYGLARKISAQRIFRKRYKMDYGWLINSEHINFPEEIIKELEMNFTIQSRRFWPLPIPITQLNLVIGLLMVPKK